MLVQTGSGLFSTEFCVMLNAYWNILIYVAGY